MKTYKYKPNKPSYMKQLNEEIKNEKTKEIIQILTDENFGNEGQRKRFIDLMTSLFNIADSDARKFIRELGKACTDIGGGMLGNQESSEEEMEMEEPEEDFDDEYEIENEYDEDEYPPYMYRKGGIMSYESIKLSPLSDEDAREIQVYLKDQAIRFQNTRDKHFIPIIEVHMDKYSSVGRELLSEIRNIARFDEV